MSYIVTRLKSLNRISESRIAILDSRSRYAELASVDGTGGRQFARIEMKCFDANHSRIKIDIRLQKLSERLRGHIAATRERNVRMPGAKLRVEASSQRGFLHALVHLEKMRMSATDADPNDFRRAFRWKRADSGDRQEECAELNCTEFFAQRKIDIFRNVVEKAER